MAIANVAARGAQTYAAFGLTNTLALTTPNTIAVGNALLVFLTVDNSGVDGGSQFIQARFTLDDSAGVFIPLGTVTKDGASPANDGVQIYVWIVKVGKALQVGETITFTALNSIPRGVASAREFSGVLVYSANTYAGAGVGTGTTATATQLTSVASGSLVVGLAGVETNAAQTGDADTTGGAWVTNNSGQSNSGTAATSISAISQYKITSGGTTDQNFATTWAGSADWAVMAIGLSAAPAFVAPAYPVENPHYPCLAGPEYLPTNSTVVPVDTGTGYNVTFPWPDSSNYNDLFATSGNFVNPSVKSQHVMSLEFADIGRYNTSLSYDIETVVLPLREVITTDPLTAAVTNSRINSSGGAAPTPTTALAALASPGGDVIWFDGTAVYPALSFLFDNTILANYVDYRVMRVGLRYLAWKDDSSPSIPGEGFDVSVGDTATVRAANTVGASALYGSWLVPEYKRNAVYQTRWLGETNLVSRGGFNTATASYNNNDVHPFTIGDLNRMGGVEQFYIRFMAQEGYDLLQTDVFLDYVEMVVEVAPERRIYVNNRLISNMINTLVDNYPFLSSLPGIMRYALVPEASGPVYIPPDSSVVFTVRQAFPASPSDRYRVDPSGDFNFTFAEALGPALDMLGADQARGFSNRELDLPQFSRSVLVNGLPEAGALTYTDTIYGAFMYDPINLFINGPFWVDSTQLSYPTFRWAAAGGYTQDLTVRVAGGVAYDKIRVYLKPELPTSAPFTISVQQPLGTPIATASISISNWVAAGAAFELGDEISYREVLVPLSVTITPPAGNVFIVGSSPDDYPWDIAGNRSTNGSFSYEWFEGTASDADDPAIVLLCTMPVPILVMDTVEVSNSSTVATCVPTEIVVPEITVSNADDYDWLTVERSIDGGATYTVVDLLEVDEAPTVVFADVGVPWDIGPVDYKITGWRHADRQSRSSVIAASAAVAHPAAAFGLADYLNGVVYLYTPVSDSALELQWSPLNPISTVQLHGVDYQIALRAPEERGLSVATVVAVANFDVCEPLILEDEQFAAGDLSMSPVPFRGVRDLENLCRLQLVLPGGHTRWVSLDLGTLSVRTVHGVYLAEITLTDLNVLDASPYED